MAFLDESGLQRFWENIVSKFVRKVDGKDLSSNDYSDEEKEKLAGLEKAIIDVTALPTENIREDVFYRTFSANVYNGEYLDYERHCYLVDTLPEVGEPAAEVNDPFYTIMNMYYALDTNTVSGYLTEELGAVFDGYSAGWYPIETLLNFSDESYGGVVSDPSDASDLIDNYFIYIFLQRKIAYYKNNKWQDINIGWCGKGVNSVVTNDPINSAIGMNSFAMGGEGTFAEGDGTCAEGIASHAEGAASHAEGHHSHTEGVASHAEGNYSHAEGFASHAEGDQSHAEGDHSHAEGEKTHAKGRSQHVHGEYNIVDPDANETGERGKYVEIVGNGTSSMKRSNVHTLDWEGNAWYAGDVYVGSTSGTNKDSGSKKLATEEFVTTYIDTGSGSKISFQDSVFSNERAGEIGTLTINGTNHTLYSPIPWDVGATGNYTSTDILPVFFSNSVLPETSFAAALQAGEEPQGLAQVAYHSSVGVQPSTGVLYGAAWNDYAEYRKFNGDNPEAGRVVTETGKDSVQYTDFRLQFAPSIISDTYGMVIGDKKEGNVPLAIGGKVLAYPYESRNTFKVGDAVCSGPNGTVSRMTREEIKEWPDRILGYYVGIPEEEEFNGRPINGRIWIRIR